MSELIEALRDEQQKRCAYGTRDDDGRTCDCKFTVAPKLRLPEQTGCPELRQAIRALTWDQPADLRAGANEGEGA